MLLKLQVVLIPIGHADMSAANGTAHKFLHLTNPQSSLSEVCDALLKRYYRLYPEEETLELDGIQDKDGCDLDPEFFAEDVFASGDVLRVLVRNSFSALSRETTTVLPADILDASNALIKRTSVEDTDTELSRFLKRSRTIWAARHLPQRSSRPSTSNSEHSIALPAAILRPQTHDADTTASPVRLPPPSRELAAMPSKIIPLKKSSPQSASKGKRITSGMLVMPSPVTEKTGPKSVFSDNDDTDLESTHGMFSQIARLSGSVSDKHSMNGCKNGQRHSEHSSDTVSDRGGEGDHEGDTDITLSEFHDVAEPPRPQQRPSKQPSLHLQPQKSPPLVLYPTSAVSKPVTPAPEAPPAISLPPPDPPFGVTPSKTLPPASTFFTTLTPHTLQLQYLGRLTSLNQAISRPDSQLVHVTQSSRPSSKVTLNPIVAKPVTELVTDSVTEPVAEPVTESVAEPLPLSLKPFLLLKQLPVRETEAVAVDVAEEEKEKEQPEPEPKMDIGDDNLAHDALEPENFSSLGKGTTPEKSLNPTECSTVTHRSPPYSKPVQGILVHSTEEFFVNPSENPVPRKELFVDTIAANQALRVVYGVGTSSSSSLISPPLPKTLKEIHLERKASIDKARETIGVISSPQKPVSVGSESSAPESVPIVHVPDYDGPALSKTVVMGMFKRLDGLVVTDKVNKLLHLPIHGSSLDGITSEEQWKNLTVNEILKNKQKVATHGQSNSGEQLMRSRASISVTPSLQSDPELAVIQEMERIRDLKSKELPYPFNEFASKAKISSVYHRLAKLNAKLDRKEAAMSMLVKTGDREDELRSSGLQDNKMSSFVATSVVSGASARASALKSASALGNNRNNGSNENGVETVLAKLSSGAEVEDVEMNEEPRSPAVVQASNVNEENAGDVSERASQSEAEGENDGAPHSNETTLFVDQENDDSDDDNNNEDEDENDIASQKGHDSDNNVAHEEDAIDSTTEKNNASKTNLGTLPHTLSAVNDKDLSNNDSRSSDLLSSGGESLGEQEHDPKQASLTRLVTNKLDLGKNHRSRPAYKKRVRQQMEQAEIIVLDSGFDSESLDENDGVLEVAGALHSSTYKVRSEKAESGKSNASHNVVSSNEDFTIRDESESRENSPEQRNDQAPQVSAENRTQAEAEKFPKDGAVSLQSTLTAGASDQAKEALPDQSSSSSDESIDDSSDGSGDDSSGSESPASGQPVEHNDSSKDPAKDISRDFAKDSTKESQNKSTKDATKDSTEVSPKYATKDSTADPAKVSPTTSPKGSSKYSPTGSSKVTTSSPKQLKRASDGQDTNAQKRMKPNGSPQHPVGSDTTASEKGDAKDARGETSSSSSSSKDESGDSEDEGELSKSVPSQVNFSETSDKVALSDGSPPSITKTDISPKASVAVPTNEESSEGEHSHDSSSLDFEVTTNPAVATSRGSAASGKEADCSSAVVETKSMPDSASSPKPLPSGEKEKALPEEAVEKDSFSSSSNSEEDSESDSSSSSEEDSKPGLKAGPKPALKVDSIVDTKAGSGKESSSESGSSSDSSSNSDSDSDSASGSISDSSSELDPEKPIDLFAKAIEAKSEVPLKPNVKPPIGRLLSKKHISTTTKPSSFSAPATRATPSECKTERNAASPVRPKTVPDAAKPPSSRAKWAAQKFAPIKKPLLARLTDLNQRGVPDVSAKRVSAVTASSGASKSSKSATNANSDWGDSSSDLSSDSSSSSDASDSDEGGISFMNLKDLKKLKMTQTKKKGNSAFLSLMRDAKKR